MKFIHVLAALLTIILFGVILYIVSIESEEDGIIWNYNPQNNPASIVDEYSNNSDAHWTHMPLTYKIKTDYCTNFTARRIRWAFETLENESQQAVSFIEIKDNSTLEKNLNQGQKINTNTSSYYDKVQKEGVDILVEPYNPGSSEVPISGEIFPPFQKVFEVV